LNFRSNRGEARSGVYSDRDAVQTGKRKRRASTGCSVRQCYCGIVVFERVCAAAAAVLGSGGRWMMRSWFESLQQRDCTRQRRTRSLRLCFPASSAAETIRCRRTHLSLGARAPDVSPGLREICGNLSCFVVLSRDDLQRASRRR